METLLNYLDEGEGQETEGVDWELVALAGEAGSDRQRASATAAGIHSLMFFIVFFNAAL